jgi:hypothetical protein
MSAMRGGDGGDRRGVHGDLGLGVRGGLDSPDVVTLFGGYRLIGAGVGGLDQQAGQLGLAADRGVDGVQRHSGAVGDRGHRGGGVAAFGEQQGLGPERPPGLIAHLAWRTETGLRYVDVWQSKDDHEAFAENRLHPVVHPILQEMLGFIPPEPAHTVLDVIDAWTDRHPA